MSTTVLVPVYDVDLYADDVLADPYPHYTRIRELGRVVWMPVHEMWAISRYEDVKAVLQDWKTYSSAQGVSVDAEAGKNMAGTLLASDPPVHTPQRKVLNDRLTPFNLRELEASIDAWADELVAQLVEQGRFDAVTELAKPFPLSVIFNIVGLPQGGREHMLAWADAAFNAQGPANERSAAALPKLLGPGGLHDWIVTHAKRQHVSEDGIAAWIYDSVNRGEIDDNQALWLLLAFATAGIDTTVNALSWAVYYFAQHPEQWQLLREDPSLVPNAFNEVLRIETPIQGWARTVTTDHALAGVRIRAGDRLLVLFASANRDELFWDQPECFDVRRNASPQLAFGRGIHVCAGMGLAKLEGHAILKALAARVGRFSLAGEPQLHLNNVVRGLGSLPVEVR
jgi:cytochrome P450